MAGINLLQNWGFENIPKKNYKEVLDERTEIVRELSKRDRKLLQCYRAALAESNGLCDSLDYLSWINGLTDDEFIGNMLYMLTNDYVAETNKRYLENGLTFDTLLKDGADPEVINKAKELYNM